VYRALVVLVVATACGRIGYDPIDDGGGDGVLPDGSGAGDGRPGLDAVAPDAFVCPAICNQGCANGVCNILGDELFDITCPPGLACHVTCEGSMSCMARIDCTAARACTVDCTGPDSCFFGATCGAFPCAIHCIGAGSCGPLDCGAAAQCSISCPAVSSCNFGVRCGERTCSVDCSGDGSCGGRVDCTTACACDVTCAAGACRFAPTCPAGCDVPAGCSSQPTGCNSC